MQDETEQGLATARDMVTAAEALRRNWFPFGRTKFYELMKAGTIPSAKIGATRYVRRSDCEKFLAQAFDGNAG